MSAANVAYGIDYRSPPVSVPPSIELQAKAVEAVLAWQLSDGLSVRDALVWLCANLDEEDLPTVLRLSRALGGIGIAAHLAEADPILGHVHLPKYLLKHAPALAPYAAVIEPGMSLYP